MPTTHDEREPEGEPISTYLEAIDRTDSRDGPPRHGLRYTFGQGHQASYVYGQPEPPSNTMTSSSFSSENIAETRTHRDTEQSEASPHSNEANNNNNNNNSNNNNEYNTPPPRVQTPPPQQASTTTPRNFATTPSPQTTAASGADIPFVTNLVRAQNEEHARKTKAKAPMPRIDLINQDALARLNNMIRLGDYAPPPAVPIPPTQQPTGEDSHRAGTETRVPSGKAPPPPVPWPPSDEPNETPVTSKAPPPSPPYPTTVPPPPQRPPGQTAQKDTNAPPPLPEPWYYEMLDPPYYNTNMFQHHRILKARSIPKET